jgi:hypothetical protein
MVQARRVGRDCDGAREQAAEEGVDEIQARRVEQKHALADRAVRLKPRADGARPLVQLAVRDTLLLRLAVGDEGVSKSLGLFTGPAAQKLDQR